MLTQIAYALPFLAQGFALTLWVSLLVVVFSLIAGVIMGVGLVYGPVPLQWAVRIFSDTIRGIPILVLIFFVYYGLPAIGLHLPSFWAAVLALTLFKTAQVVEYFRGAVGSIPKGQSEAAMAIGLTFRQRLAYVIFHLPTGVQALPAALDQRRHRCGQGQRAGIAARHHRPDAGHQPGHRPHL
ncbi:amino acid ABC transporter permease [Mesorhizobium sp. M7A.F.Ca.MR.362.00.0.0]|uniref:amino acid ABC transporter permease n=1 Tax=Mesorhizobium sp. M7A.F.Ca.MR.362.00.0.0 TaxID=2496779 RepID=UPI001FDFC6E7|nr:ABC transporter permease subunit [Mesorhizobium sp. M7A.F.Ca.MR.362.00.0.0]